MTKSILHRARILRSSFVGSLAALLCAFPSAGRGQEALEAPRPHLLTLHDCIVLALQESPALEASRFDVASANEEVRAERGKTLPELTGAASAQIFSGSPTSKFAIVNTGNQVGGPGVGVASNRGVGATGVELYSGRLTYPIFKDGSLFGLNKAPAIASKEAKKRGLAWTTQLRRDQVIDRITDAYITTVSAQNRAGYAERRVRLLELMVGITQEQSKQGLTLPIDLKLAQGQLRGAQSLAKILREQGTVKKVLNLE